MILDFLDFVAVVVDITLNLPYYGQAIDIIVEPYSNKFWL